MSVISYAAERLRPAPVASVRQTSPRVTRGPQRGVLTVGVLLAVALAVVIGVRHGPRATGLFGLGLGLGVALFHARFGFTSGWRQLVAVGQGRAVRAHALLLGLTATLLAPILAHGVGLGGVTVGQELGSIGVALLIGAAMFGAGMQIGGSCASGTLFAVGSGQTAIVLTLGGFVTGSAVGAWNIAFWRGLPAHAPINLAGSRFGYAGGWLITMLALAVMIAVSVLVQRRRKPPPIAPVPAATGSARIWRGSWPLWVGAVVLAVFAAGVLAASGRPWGVTGAFALWGSKLAGALGGHPQSWSYWQGDSAATLHGSVLAFPTSLTDIGIMVGALLASAAAGAFTLHRRVPWRLAIGSVLGGVLMGYGARLAAGCNIGAYLGGISSFSLSGWIWGVMALLGTWIGLRARPLFGHTNPKPTDSVC